MLAPLSWLKEYVALPPLQKLVERLNQTGTTVAGVNSFGQGLDKIIVGQIIEVNPHPNADKLQLALVQVPGKKLEIVCGAHNIAASQKVPVALVGTSVPFGPEGVPLKIERRKIRDIESNGMLCSAKELGLGEDHSGILILPDETKVGTKLTSVLGLPDTVLDIEVTTNRGDELSIYGLAREVAAVTGAKVKRLDSPKVPIEAKEIKNLKVRIDDPKLCPRYSAVVVTDLKIGPSPAFIQTRLRESGLRPVGNVVDITNYVMLLTGQPLHAFDQSRVQGGITVRESKVGERVTTLDGVTRVLGFGSIVIADTKKILGLAGVMGGEESSVTDLTDTIVLESAVFDPVAVRRTAMKYNLRSEASLRFERGVDTAGTLRALGLATDLLKRYAGGVIGGPIVDHYPSAEKSAEVTLTASRLNQYLGFEFPMARAADTLEKLGFELIRRTIGSLTVRVPSHRAGDIAIEEDLIEEVARIEGYAAIPSNIPGGVIPPGLPHPEVNLERTLKEHLTSLGLQEVVNFSFVAEDIAGEEKALKIANAISKEWAYLRTNITVGLAQTMAVNFNFGSSAPLFEVGKIYLPRDGDLPYEKLTLAVVGSQFGEVKGYLESLFAKLGLPTGTYFPCQADLYQDRTAASVWLGDTLVGELGTLSRVTLDKVGLRRQTVAAELDLISIFSQVGGARQFRPIAKYPSVREDLSVMVGVQVTVADVVAAVSSAGARDLVDIEPFDIFADPKLGTGKKSVLLSLTFQSGLKTLTDSEVREEKQKIEKVLKDKLSAKIR